MAPGIADKKNNSLPLWGNEKTMNLNNLILTNILSSHYFKVNLYQLKTYHEVIDEIYFNVTHLEPWEKGSRKTSGQTGMCGGVRGVGAGGIVSTAFCILYKLFTLKLTRKQVVGLITHCDSPFIRALGFMYVRYTQPPGDLWDWFEPYLDDEEELDVKAGGGQTMTIGEMLRHFLTKLEWFSTLFPRIPLPIQKDIDTKLSGRNPAPKAGGAAATAVQNEDKSRWPEESTGEELKHRRGGDEDAEWNEEERPSRDRRSPDRETKRHSYRERSERKEKLDVADEIARERERQRREKERSHSSRRHRSRSNERQRNSRHGDQHSRSRSRSREPRSHRESRYNDKHSDRERDYWKQRERRHSRERERRDRNYERRPSGSQSAERRPRSLERDNVSRL